MGIRTEHAIYFQTVMRLYSIYETYKKGDYGPEAVQRFYRCVGTDGRHYHMHDFELDEWAKEFLTEFERTERELFIVGYITPTTQIAKIIIAGFAEYVCIDGGFTCIDPRNGEPTTSVYLLTNQK